MQFGVYYGDFKNGGQIVAIASVTFARKLNAIINQLT